nr:reverse transcriptase domain-containing protein [Tanacetum cinerariifolium]
MDWLSIVKTDKVIHTIETDIMKLVVGFESFDISADKFNKETGSSDGLQPKQADLSYVHALNELYLHEIRVVPRPELVQETTKKISQIKDRLKAAQDRQKTYADKRRTSLEFSVGDYVFVGISLYVTTLTELPLVIIVPYTRVSLGN